MIDELYEIRKELKYLSLQIYLQHNEVKEDDLDNIVNKINILIDKIYKVDIEITTIESTTDEMLTLSRCNIIKEIIGGIKEDGKETK